MRFLVLKLFILFSSFNTISQEKRFEFETVDMRTPDGWEIRNISGEVVIYEDNKSHTISIVTENKNYKMYVKSKQLFVRQYCYLYTLIDDDDDESSVRIVMENKCDDYIEFYFYSDRPGEIIIKNKVEIPQKKEK
jgi:hypothetical protein